MNRGRFSDWNQPRTPPCAWPGISCFGDRVTGIDLSGSEISGGMFGNFSAFTALTHLNLSGNTISGEIPADLGRCQNLKFLNLSHNLIAGELNLTGLNKLEVLDVSLNRISGGIQLTFPGICDSLVLANLSTNSFTGSVFYHFDSCWNLQFLDLSANNFSGNVWPGFARLREFSVSENQLVGAIFPAKFPGNCTLKLLDLSGNAFAENWSTNNFEGDIQDIFGRFNQVQFLVLHSNSYIGGMISSGILNLKNISRLDLSFNNFSGPLPVEISYMTSLKFLILAYNQFTGKIPLEYGNLQGLQALDLSFNLLNGSLPRSFGNLSSLLWLMLANNALTGNGIFPACAGGLRTFQISGYVQLSGNQLSGEIPIEIGKMQNFSMLHLGINGFFGDLPPEIGLMPLVVLNISQNKFSGEIPAEIGNIKCLQTLDLSCNNFSGAFPANLNNLSELNKFNVSYNPSITGKIPITGQLATFEKESFLGDPFLRLPSFLKNTTDSPTTKNEKKPMKRSPVYTPEYVLKDTKVQHDFLSSSGTSSPCLSSTVKVIRLDKAVFTHDDILKATMNFSDDRVIRREGFGTVYRGLLPDGRKVAVKRGYRG
ncbi:hypothetical protein HYC85_004892 [Camellia sinensis]|uniref:Leucine-rich repeat-containing N-terminal plant-type domain-containing protein n=1 Tax=Camellia sinensis TaxID=4442 RepID=A0A7J7HZ44_CAMSI|nr:hypothetical protein HYC85_004892 [Camellia sinensis]